MENATDLHFPQIVGQTPQIEEIRQTIQKTSTNDVPVLITGEPGTSKDLIVE
jgi:DNA-binding NtrC family response regulator